MIAIMDDTTLTEKKLLKLKKKPKFLYEKIELTLRFSKDRLPTLMEQNSIDQEACF